VTWNDVLSATALEQAALVRSRALSSEELCRLYLDRIARHDPGLNAFVSSQRRRALSDARAKDVMVRRGDSLPAFHGVPVGIKDLNLVRFAWTRFGSRGAPPIFSPVDDRTTASLRRGGFVVLGKLSTSELGAMPITEPDIHPPTRNPWNRWHTSGGSSGGSGAAVAAGLIPIAQGSDGAGSIRIPSAFCHLYGIKPSRGRVANAFGKDDREILYTCGPIARSVEDAAAMLDVMAGLDVGRPHWAPPPAKPYRAVFTASISNGGAPRPLRIRFATRAPIGETHPEIAAAVERAALLLADLGHQVEEGPLPEGSVEEFLPLWQHLIADFPFAIWSRTQPVTRWLAEPGRSLRLEDVTALKRKLEARFLRDLGDADVWVTPTVAVPAPRVGSFAALPPAEAFAAAARIGVFTAAFNVTGQPAASVPLGLTSEGLPMGLQVAARLYHEEDVIAVSRQLEEAAPWRGRTAPVGD
jgi:amidase